MVFFLLHYAYAHVKVAPLIVGWYVPCASPIPPWLIAEGRCEANRTRFNDKLGAKDNIYSLQRGREGEVMGGYHTRPTIVDYLGR